MGKHEAYTCRQIWYPPASSITRSGSIWSLMAASRAAFCAPYNTAAVVSGSA